MFLLTIRKKFIRELTLIGVVLTALVAVVYHMFIPDRYFLWFPFNPDILLSVWFILHSYVFVLLSHGTGKTGNVLFVMQSFEIYLKCLGTDSICFLYRT